MFGKKSYNTQGPVWHNPNKPRELYFKERSIKVNKSFSKGAKSEKYNVELLDDLVEEEGYNKYPVRIVASSAWGQDRINDYIASGYTFEFKKDIGTLYSTLKSEDNFICPADIINKEECGVDNNTDASEALKKLNIPFDSPKPVSLLQYLIRATCYDDKNATILDFFSGSATTAHAVMQLNAEDGGNRRFIMVQLPEETDPKSEAAKAGYTNICEIGKERIRRAGEKIKAENPDKDLDVGFRVLRVDSDNMADIAKRPSDVTQEQLKLDVENIIPERSDLDLLFGVMVDCGLMLDMPIETKQMNDKTYYVVNHGDLVACFEKNIPEKLIYEIARMNPVCAVFRDSSFAEPKDKINLAEIFKNITGNDKCVKVL